MSPRSLLVLVPVLAAACFAGDAEEELILLLSERQPAAVRRSAAEALGRAHSTRAIKTLMDRLGDAEPDVRAECAKALAEITRKELGENQQAWREWWNDEGKRLFGDARIPAAHASSRPGDSQQAQQYIAASRDLLAVTAGAIALASFLLLAVFGMIAGYRLKQVKEVLRRAEKYVSDAEEVAKNSDRAVAALETKRAEIFKFFDEQKEDHQAEIERFADLLEQNVEHRMREVTMGLREKAEKEIEGTLTQLKEDVSREVKRATEEQKQRILEEFNARERKFMNEVEAHTIFLEASFYYITGKYEEALKQYKKLLLLKPDHWVAWNNKGTVLREMGRIDEALEAYAKALELSPDNAEVHYNVAATYARVRKRDKMLEMLRRAVASDAQMSDEALNDPSFKEYWTDAAFKEVAEA